MKVLTKSNGITLEQCEDGYIYAHQETKSPSGLICEVYGGGNSIAAALQRMEESCKAFVTIYK